MANQSGLFAFDRGCTLRQSGEDVWLGERQGDLARHPSGLTATWDGRIDNRDELLMRLGERTAPDADIALAMFAPWGTAGLASMVGEWSLVVWDAARRTVHPARDYMGAGPLYYSAAAAHAAWPADLCGLVTR